MCICGLIIQHDKRIRHVVLSSVASTDLQYSCTLSHKQHDFWKKLLNMKYILIFPTNFVWQISHDRYYRKFLCIHVKYTLFFPDFNKIWIYT